MVNRVLRDDPSKSDMHNRQGLDLRMIWKSIKDWRLWPIYVLGLVHMSMWRFLLSSWGQGVISDISGSSIVPVGPPQVYLTLSLRNLGFNTTETNLLTIPSVVIGGVLLVFAAWFSEAVDSRVAATLILQLWALPLLIALYTFNEETSQWIYFTAITLIAGFPYVHPIQVAWASRNSYSVRQRYELLFLQISALHLTQMLRTVSASIYNMFVQAGSIVYVNLRFIFTSHKS